MIEYCLLCAPVRDGSVHIKYSYLLVQSGFPVLVFFHVFGTMLVFGIHSVRVLLVRAGHTNDCFVIVEFTFVGCTHMHAHMHAHTCPVLLSCCL